MYYELIFFIIVSIVILIIIKYKIDKLNIDSFYETTATEENLYKHAMVSDDSPVYADGHEKMTFDFLTNTNDILAKYYFSDDLNNNDAYSKNVNIYPYKNSIKNFKVVGALPNVYTANRSLHIQRKPGIWNRYNTKAQDIYNLYAVRR